MNNLLALWGEAFQKMYPNARIQIEGKGSSTAPGRVCPHGRAFTAPKDKLTEDYITGRFG